MRATLTTHTPRIPGSTPSYSGICITTRRSLRSSGPPSREPQMQAQRKKDPDDTIVSRLSWLWNWLPAGMCVVQGEKMKHQELMWQLNGSNLFKKTFSSFTSNETFPIPTRTPHSSLVVCSNLPRRLIQASAAWAVFNGNMEEKSFQYHFSSWTRVPS